MANSALDLVQDALETLGVYSAGETASDADAARMFFVLNALLDELAGQNIFVYQIAPQIATIVAAQPAYTIGEVGASITAPRPPKIAYGDAAASFTPVLGTVGVVNVVSSIEFKALSAYAPPPGTPDTLWYNPTYPNGTLTLLPTPMAGGSLTFYPWARLASFASLNTSAVFAVGVLDALRDSLAVASKPYFRDAQIDPVIVARAAASKDFLRYQSMTSRAMFNRFALSTNPAKPT